jgi:hypothetical protein
MHVRLIHCRSGKSVLASVVIKELMGRYGKNAISFFFCDHAEPLQRSLISILRTILSQFLWQQPDIPAPILKITGDGRGRNFDSFATCMETFLDVFKDREDPYYIVLDALDELEDGKPENDKPSGPDRPDLHSFLRNISSISRRVKVLVTGREEDHLQRALSTFPAIRVSEEATHDDVQRMVLSEVRKLRLGGPELEDSAVEKILRKSAGIFRLASLVIADAQVYASTFKLTPYYWDNLPTTLFGMYDRYLERMTRHHYQPLVHLALRLLKIVVAASRPLEWKELEAALEIHPGSTNWEPRNELSEDLNESLLSLCSPLIEFRGSQNVLYLTHLSVKEYLLSLSPAVLSPGNSQSGDFSIYQCHLDLAARCLTYLSIRPISQSPSPEGLWLDSSYQRENLGPLFANFPFLRYAIQNWAHHYLQSHKEAGASANELREILIQSEQSWRWLESFAFLQNTRKQGEYWVQLFQIRSQVLGQQDLTTIYTGFCLTMAYDEQNDADSATAWLKWTLSVLLSQSQSPDVQRGVEQTIEWMSHTFLEEDESKRMLVMSWFTKAAQSFGPLHPTTRCLLRTLGSSWPSKEAELYEKIFQYIKRCGGINNEGAIEISETLLRVYEREKLWAKAKSLCLEYFIPPAISNSLAGGMRSSLARIAESQDSLEDVQAVYKWHVDSLGPTSPETQVTALVLGKLYAKNGRLTEVERIWRTNFRGQIDQTSQQGIDMASTLGRLYTFSGRFEQAEGIYQVYFTNCKESLGSASAQTANAAYVLGQVLDIQGKYDELKSLFHRLCEDYVLELDEAKPVPWTIVDRLNGTKPGPWKIVDYLTTLPEITELENFWTAQLEVLLSTCEERFTTASEITWELARRIAYHLDDNGNETEAVNLCRRYYLGDNGEEDLTLERDREVSWAIANIQRLPKNLHSEMTFLTEARRIFGDARYPALFAAEAVLKTLFNLFDENRSESSFDTTDSNDVPDLSDLSSVLDTLQHVFHQWARSDDEGFCGFNTREFGASLADFYTILSPCTDFVKAENLHRLLFEAARDSEKFGIQGWWTLVMLKRLGEDLYELGNIEEEERLYLEMMQSFKGALGKRHDRTIAMVRCLRELYKREGFWDKKKDLEREMLEGIDRATLERAARATQETSERLWSCSFGF